MNPGAFKVIILGIILTVLAFVVGSQAAESSRESLMTLGGIGFLFLLLVVGKKCWWLLFCVPPIARLLPLGSISEIGIPFVLASVILIYWIIMWAMGYVRVTWHKSGWMDGIILLLLVYMAFSYLRNPVSVGYLQSLGIEAEYIGGEPYAYAIAGSIYYIALSIIPISRKELGSVLKWAYICTGIATVLASIMAPSKFMNLGVFVVNSLICYYPLSQIVLSPWKFAILVLGVLSYTRTGQRSAFAAHIVGLIFMSSVWRNFILIITLGLAGVATVYYASSQRLLLELPEKIQRPLASLPGIVIDEGVAKSAEHSSEWRYVMWRWAIDPRSGYIKDYVWGDGCAQSVEDMNREATMMMRGTLAQGDQAWFAERGVWHNGAIDVVHRLGFVGLTLFLACQLSVLFYIWRICRAIIGTKMGFFLCFSIFDYTGKVFVFYAGDGHITHLFQSFPQIVFIKVAYSILRKDGIIPPLLQRHIYVPLAIREHESAQNQLVRAE